MPAVYRDTVYGYNRAALRYRDCWAPIIAQAAIRLLDRVDEGFAGRDAFNLVDIGTGSGTLALAALERWQRAGVIAVDPSIRLIEIAAAAAQARGGDGERRLTLREGAAASLPLPNSSADVAVSSFVIQLVPSRAAALREAFRVLRPGGLFACVTWQDRNDVFRPMQAFEDAVDDLGLDWPDPGPDPRSYASPREAAGELRRAGFRRVDARREWLEHRYTPDSYLATLEGWLADDLFEPLSETDRERLRRAALGRLNRLPADALVWRAPLVSVVGAKP
ncbi:MAG: class I SAM-dependent methyltransferase [Chloroflexota bacterium]|nr:class I SAM-dependent methyltransferase [Chloroflexota bacterium]